MNQRTSMFLCATWWTGILLTASVASTAAEAKTSAAAAAPGKAVQPFPHPGELWENSLGMRFVPVRGTNVLFSIWETRVQEFAAFMQETGRSWEKSGDALQPAMDISWGGAKEFCRWLTEKDRRAGRLKPSQFYRLPTDAEWSIAVGLPDEGTGTPQEKDMRIKGVYPWGTGWPPPSGAGNYGAPLRVDGFSRPSPVGSFAPNPHGLYDLGGNLWEWVEDKWDANETNPVQGPIIPDKDWLASCNSRVLRGGSFYIHDPYVLLSSYRLRGPDLRYTAGFRVVLATAMSAAAAKPDGSK